MTISIPAGSPQTLGEAFGHIYTIEKPTINDLKVMVMVEAAGMTLYEETAKATDHQGVKDLLLHNGREEMAHAHRVSKAIKALTGEDFPPPAAADNPYLVGPIPSTPVTAEGLIKTSEAEFGGTRSMRAGQTISAMKKPLRSSVRTARRKATTATACWKQQRCWRLDQLFLASLSGRLSKSSTGDVLSDFLASFSAPIILRANSASPPPWGEFATGRRTASASSNFF
jgi:hypothetical protein